ncbi:hypothetical protein DY251_07730 [Mesorhizobium denitrificans]|uniref:Uncharacterized protein n=1 Tax=Mesorhizobium denitrificans TaxID=2294114 RepID=A0A371XG00_9HYPH|nr:hypothetical protein DY251_07730 [Mesorhizobium denitrificans]
MRLREYQRREWRASARRQNDELRLWPWKTRHAGERIVKINDPQRAVNSCGSNAWKVLLKCTLTIGETPHHVTSPFQQPLILKEAV